MSEKQLMLSTQEALMRLLRAAPVISETEMVNLQNANRRVLAEPVFSHIDVPNADNSSMDGYAVKCEDCLSGKAVLKVAQRISAGMVGQPLKKGEAARIFTGAPIPEGADTVVIQENCSKDGDKVVIHHVPQAGEWIRLAGENIKKGQKILDKGTRLLAQHLGYAASVGCLELAVIRRVKVAFFTTGNELVMPGKSLGKGQVYNSNRYMLFALLENLGCEVVDLGNVPDNQESVQNMIRENADLYDLILASGGMSVGEEDHVKEAVAALGKIDFWTVAVKPGKPLAYGEVNRAIKPAVTPFIGVPGNPVSTFVCFLVFIRPFLLKMMGLTNTALPARQMRADFTMKKAEARNEFLRAKINDQNGLDLFENQGSGILSSIIWCDGFIDNPPGNIIKKGDMVRFIPLHDLMHS